MVKGIRSYDAKMRRRIRRQNHKDLDLKTKVKHNAKPPAEDDWNNQNWRLNDELGID